MAEPRQILLRWSLGGAPGTKGSDCERNGLLLQLQCWVSVALVTVVTFVDYRWLPVALLLRWQCPSLMGSYVLYLATNLCALTVLWWQNLTTTTVCYANSHPYNRTVSPTHNAYWWIKSWGHYSSFRHHPPKIASTHGGWCQESWNYSMCGWPVVDVTSWQGTLFIVPHLVYIK